MSKQSKSSRTTPTGPASNLTHSPFAKLKELAGPGAPDAQAVQETEARDAEVAPPVPRSAITKDAKQPGPAKEPEPSSAKKSRGRLVLRRETKHRGGKAVIVITGFAALREFPESAIEALAKQLKQQLGCGGTVEERGAEREIVLQGDRAAKVAEVLRAQGFRVEGVTS
jgi:translation initiation factor 1